MVEMAVLECGEDKMMFKWTKWLLAVSFLIVWTMASDLHPETSHLVFDTKVIQVCSIHFRLYLAPQ